VDGLTLVPRADLAQMSLADAPDYMTAIAAGIAHGLEPKHALRSAFGKWLTDNKEAVEGLGLANVYAENGAMVDQSRSLQFALLLLAEQQRQIVELTERLNALEG